MLLSPSLIAVTITVALGSVSLLLDRLLKYCWKDGRTRRHKIARTWLIALTIAAGVSTVVLALGEKFRAEKQSRQFLEELKSAEIDRKARTFSGHLDAPKGIGQMYAIGDSGATFFVTGYGSLLDLLSATPSLRAIAEQNHISSKTVDGRLLVSAKLRGRDGQLVEISDNEWKVSQPPRSWDRNYSTNALEVKDGDGNIVFQIRLGAKRSHSTESAVVSFQGVFFDLDGNAVAFTSGTSVAGACVSVLKKEDPGVPIPKIIPLFKYPSDRHLGELVERE